MPKLDETFSDALLAQGLANGVSWLGDGTIEFHDSVTDDQRTKVESLRDSHLMPEQ